MNKIVLQFDSGTRRRRILNLIEARLSLAFFLAEPATAKFSLLSSVLRHLKKVSNFCPPTSSYSADESERGRLCRGRRLSKFPERFTFISFEIAIGGPTPKNSYALRRKCA